MATRAAARHLRDLYHEFGDWYLAIAAYNCGPVNVEKAVERTGYADFWELRGRGVLPAETTNYVPIILAMTIMEKNAAEYGIDNITPEAPVEYDTIQMASPTSLVLVSDLTESPVSELSSLNPSVLKSIVPQGYPLHVPKGTGNNVLAALETVPAEKRNAWRVHRVSGGETLATIGKRYGVAPQSIAAANGLKSIDAVEGDRVLVPAVFREEPAARRTAARTATAGKSSTRTTTAARRRTPARATGTTVRKATTPSKPAPRRKPVAVAQTASR
jgi:membrane-bound lytic murein transglycosylase D